MSRAAYQRDYRSRRRAIGGGPLRLPVETPVAGTIREPDPAPPDDPAGAVAEWSKARLKVPPGHRLSGEALILPDFAVRFFREALADGIREAGLFCARKNGKSAILAVLILAHLAEDGPLRRRGWRGGLASLSREKGSELWQQLSDIASASDLKKIVCGKAPRHVSSEWGRVDFLSADRTAGHSSGFDLAICDELGLFPERGRGLMAGLLTSTSTRDGRLIAISCIGDSDLSLEMIERDDPATVVHVYAAPKDCALDDESAWHASNPSLKAGIKSISYMRDMARRAAASPPEQAAFRCYDLNQRGSASRQMLVPLDVWRRCSREPLPEREGPCFVGFDLGGSTSMTAGAAYWPEVGRLQVWGAFGNEPGLSARGEADGVGLRYERMAARGELRTWPGRVTPVAEFFRWLSNELRDERILLAAADRYRQAEGLDALAEAGVTWPMEWRAQGSGPSGSADVRAFQGAVESGRLRPGQTLLLESAILESELRWDSNGNPSIEKRRRRGRIDALSSAVLAVGIGSRGHVQDFSFYRPAQAERM